MTWARTFLVALPVAALNEAATWRDIEPDALAAAIYVVCGLSLLALGFVAVWRGMIAFIPWFLIIAAVEETLVFKPSSSECDPFCSSPLNGVIVLPICLVVVGAGGLARVVAALWRAKRDVMPTPL